MSAVKSKRVGIAIDMTPMVDVAFLLLIFYMSTTTLKPPDKNPIKLPMSHSVLQPPENKTITLGISKDDSIELHYKARVEGKIVDVDIPVTIESLQTELNKARGYIPGAYINVKMDMNAKFGTIDKVMEQLKQMELQRFNVLTELPA